MPIFLVVPLLGLLGGYIFVDKLQDSYQPIVKTSTSIGTILLLIGALALIYIQAKKAKVI